MANWCSTWITFSGDPEQVRILHEELLKARDTGDEDLKKDWLGKLLLHIGYSSEEASNDKICFCDGYIVYHEYYPEHDELRIDTESKYVPALLVFRCFLEHFHLDEVELIYEAIEMGNEIYATNDPALKGCWIFNSWKQDLLPPPMDEYAWKVFREEELNDLLSKVLKKKGSTKALAIEFVDKYDSCSIYPYEFADVDEWS